MLEKGVLVYNVKTNIVFKIMEAERTQYDCKVRIKSQSSNRVLIKRESEMDNYRFSLTGEWVVARNEPRNYNRLTDADTQFIIDNYGTMPLKDIAEVLKRDKKNVATLASNLRRKGIHVDLKK